ncbi:MAG: hypothetical protein L3J74_00665, partial [Bacteroidales bacterium]|nr:hypothetical protein [Bacteroidales bacterium]
MDKKNVTTLLAVVITTVLFFSLFSCKTQSVYTVNRIEQTGDLNHTTSKRIDEMQYSKDARMLYSVYNDDQNLYVVMSVTDKTVQKKILIAGLTFWMDTVAKKKEQFGITFPRAGSMKNSFSKMNNQTFFNFEKVSKRTHLDIASVNSAIKISIENDVISEAHISLGGVAAIPKYLNKTGEFLMGKEISIDTITEAEAVLQSEITPISDVRGTSDYKRLLAKQLFFAHFVELFRNKVSFQNLI